jgi:hypothetical protein
MAKRVILYNLADGVTEEQYEEYVHKVKGPLLESLPTVTKYELVKVTGSMMGKIPYKYVGILHVGNLKEMDEKAGPMKEYRDFQAKIRTMLKDVITLNGEEIY